MRLSPSTDLAARFEAQRLRARTLSDVASQDVALDRLLALTEAYTLIRKLNQQ